MRAFSASFFTSRVCVSLALRDARTARQHRDAHKPLVSRLTALVLLPLMLSLLLLVPLLTPPLLLLLPVQLALRCWDFFCMRHCWCRAPPPPLLLLLLLLLLTP